MIHLPLLIERALQWRDRVHTGRTESEMNIYLQALMDVGVPQEKVDKVEEALMPSNEEET